MCPCISSFVSPTICQRYLLMLMALSFNMKSKNKQTTKQNKNQQAEIIWTMQKGIFSNVISIWQKAIALTKDVIFPRGSMLSNQCLQKFYSSPVHGRTVNMQVVYKLQVAHLYCFN